MSNNAPIVHSVQFYDTHEALIDRLSGVVCSGLLIGNSALIVATKEHRDQLLAVLVDRLEVDLRKFAREGRFAMRDARETMNLFMVNGMPDARRFQATVGNVLNEAKRAAKTEDRGLTVFGEMVAVLWEEGNKKGALALEKLWNDTLNDRSFYLHCAYPRALFKPDDSDMRSICDAHSHIFDSYPIAV